MNTLRCQKANTGLLAKKLPPTDDSFRLHLLHCMFQIYIWKHAHIPNVEISSATQYGYEEETATKSLMPQMTTQVVAAP